MGRILTSFVFAFVLASGLFRLALGDDVRTATPPAAQQEPAGLALKAPVVDPGKTAAAAEPPAAPPAGGAGIQGGQADPVSDLRAQFEQLRTQFLALAAKAPAPQPAADDGNKVINATGKERDQQIKSCKARENNAKKLIPIEDGSTEMLDCLNSKLPTLAESTSADDKQLLGRTVYKLQNDYLNLIATNTGDSLDAVKSKWNTLIATLEGSSNIALKATGLRMRAIEAVLPVTRNEDRRITNDIRDAVAAARDYHRTGNRNKIDDAEEKLNSDSSNYETDIENAKDKAKDYLSFLDDNNLKTTDRFSQEAKNLREREEKTNLDDTLKEFDRRVFQQNWDPPLQAFRADIGNWNAMFGMYDYGTNGLAGRLAFPQMYQIVGLPGTYVAATGTGQLALLSNGTYPSPIPGWNANLNPGGTTIPVLPTINAQPMAPVTTIPNVINPSQVAPPAIGQPVAGAAPIGTRGNNFFR